MVPIAAQGAMLNEIFLEVVHISENLCRLLEEEGAASRHPRGGGDPRSVVG